MEESSTESRVWTVASNADSSTVTGVDDDENQTSVKDEGKNTTRKCCSKHLCNIGLLGLGFMFTMGAFFTCMISQTVVLNSVHDEYFEGTSTMGYICLAINFAAMTISFFLSPAVSALIGPKTAMVLGAGLLTLSIGVFLRPLEMTLYFGSLCQGIGAGIMWTVYGHFLTENSTDKTIGRNTGLFWVLFQTGPVCGNLFYFFLTNGALSITPATRYTLFSVLLPASGVGVAMLALLRHPWVHDSLSVKSSNAVGRGDEKATKLTPWKALRGELDMLLSREMFLLVPMFVYMGIELTFWMNVYGTSLGYTVQFGAIRESLVGLNGVCLGLGQVVGGFFYGAIGGFLRRKGRDVGVLLAFLVHIVAFYLAFLLLPERSSLEMTESPSYVEPSPYMALAVSLLLGFGDAGWNNPLFALFGSLYPNDPVSAFAIFQAYQSFGNVISFAYSTVLTVPYQLMIIVIVAVLGLFGYCMVEWKVASDEIAAAKEKKRLAEQSWYLNSTQWSSKEVEILNAVNLPRV